MNESGSFISFFRSRDRYDVFEFFQDLSQGEKSSWIALGVIVGIICFFAIYKKITGKQFVKSKKERREARKRRKHVIWEYTRK